MKILINYATAMDVFILRIPDLLGSFDADLLVCITTNADKAVCRPAIIEGTSLWRAMPQTTKDRLSGSKFTGHLLKSRNKLGHA
jgi:hypothetical protein